MNYISRKDIVKLSCYWLSNCLFKLPFYFLPMPVNLALSITNKCSARCKTCNIWKIYLENPSLLQYELTLDEWRKVLKSIGKSPLWVTISGGNQFLRKDLVYIMEYLVDYCEPAVINFPVSGVFSELISAKIKQILEVCKRKNIKLIINISLDGLGPKQDRLRGVRGDFKKTMKTYNELLKLKGRYSNFYLGIYTIISAFNVNDIREVYAFVAKEIKPDAYMVEIAEQREELKNTSEKIFPSLDGYASAICDYFSLFRKKYSGIFQIKELIRRKYYKSIYKSKKIPCRAGVVSAQISPYGDIWPCCTRAEIMGNLKKQEYDFKKIWFGRKAGRIRKEIKEKKCYCTHCNPYYTNTLFHPPSLVSLFKDYLAK